MTQDYIPAADAAFNDWITNFLDKCSIYETELGLDAKELGEIIAATQAFTADYAALNVAKSALEATTDTKNLTRKSTTAVARAYAKQFKGIQGLNPAILTALKVVAPSSSGPVTVVTGLTVNGCDDGVNTLKWNRNGNAASTQFIIEASPNGSTLWDLVDVVTRTNYNHTGQTPGERQYYRIRSKRAGITSQPSPAVVVYSNGAGPGLQIAA